MGSTRRRFTEEYKAQAVGFVINDHRPIAEVARNIGVHAMTLGNWVKKAKESGESPTTPLDSSERAEANIQPWCGGAGVSVMDVAAWM